MRPAAFVVYFVLLLLACLTKVRATTGSWCDPELCSNGMQHVACNNDGKFHKRCPSDAIMIDLTNYRAEILHGHNKRRNFIAAGLLPGYYPAARMATMVWDEELEYLATLNLKTCDLEHDDCHHSYRFRNVGQNLSGTDRRRHPVVNVLDIIGQSLRMWFGEYPLIDSSYMTKFRADSHFDKYGHFAETVVDRNTHVGCAMMRFTNPQYPFLYIYNTACNYASVYAEGVPVYRAGTSASECKTGRNPFYPALCSVQEEFNPNYY